MTLKIRTSALAILLVAGISGLSAQNYRGNQYLRNQRGGCVATATLSEAQQAEVAKLSDAHRSEMDALRTNLRSSATVEERQAYRAKMDASQATHRQKIVELGAQPANVPHAGFYGRGAGYNRPAGGRGLGPCGGGLGPRR
jgi:hypothetical protein